MGDAIVNSCSAASSAASERVLQRARTSSSAYVCVEWRFVVCVENEAINWRCVRCEKMVWCIGVRVFVPRFEGRVLSRCRRVQERCAGVLSCVEIGRRSAGELCMSRVLRCVPQTIGRNL